MGFHVTFQKADLAQAMKQAVRFIPSHPTHVIQRFFRLTADQATRRVDLYAQNAEGDIRWTLCDQQFGENPAAISQNGVVAIEGRTLYEIIKKLPGPHITFQTNDRDMVTSVSSGKAKYELLGTDPTLFTDWNSDVSAPTVTVSARDLIQLLSHTTFAAAGPEDKRITLSGVNLRVDDAGLHAEATNSFRLAKYRIDTDTVAGDARSAIVPATSLDRLTAMLPDDDDELVTLELGQTNLVARWSDDDIRVTFARLEGVYPDLSRVVPETYKGRATLDREMFLAALDRVHTICGSVENQLARFTLTATEIAITARAPEIGRVEDRIAITAEGLELETALNVRYLQEALKSFSANQQVTLEWTGSGNPIILRPIDQDGLALVLPVRMAESVAPLADTKTKSA